MLAIVALATFGVTRRRRRRPGWLGIELATKFGRPGGISQRDERLHVVDERPEAVLRERTLPLRHRRAANSGADGSIQVFSLHPRGVGCAIDEGAERRRALHLLGEEV